MDTESSRSPVTRGERFEQLFTAHYAAVLAYARRRASLMLAEEAASDTFLVAWRRFDVVPDDELPWLLGVTRRTLANQRRSGDRSQALVARLSGEREPPVRSSPEPVQDDVAPRIARALELLSEREREALLLVAWEGLSSAQAARVVGCSSAAFRLRLHRGRRRMATELGRGQANQEQAINRASMANGTTP